MEAWTCMSKRLDSVGLRCVSNSILCRLSKCKCRTSKWCYYCALFCLFVCDTELQNKCCKQKVQQQTIGRHSDPSDSFSFQTSQTDLCVFVFFMCIHSTCVFSSKLLCVSMTTSVNCGCPRDSSVKPVNFSYITDTHAHSDEQFECPVYTRVCMCGIGSLHHLYVVGCFSCSPAFASPALLQHAADHLPRLVSILQAKACYVAPLCQAAPGHETLLLLHNQLREFQQIDVWNNFIKSRCLFCFVVGEDYEVNPWWFCDVFLC